MRQLADAAGAPMGVSLPVGSGTAILGGALDTRVRPRGKTLLVQALPLVRSGSRSAMQTRARLMFHRAGFPEPELNEPVRDAHGGWLLDGEFVWRAGSASSGSTKGSTTAPASGAVPTRPGQPAPRTTTTGSSRSTPRTSSAALDAGPACAASPEPSRSTSPSSPSSEQWRLLVGAEPIEGSRHARDPPRLHGRVPTRRLWSWRGGPRPRSICTARSTCSRGGQPPPPSRPPRGTRARTPTTTTPPTTHRQRCRTRRTRPSSPGRIGGATPTTCRRASRFTTCPAA